MIDVELSPETRRAQARYARTVRFHGGDEPRVDAARRAWAECLAADLRRRADALVAEEGR